VRGGVIVELGTAPSEVLAFMVSFLSISQTSCGDSVRPGRPEI